MDPHWQILIDILILLAAALALGTLAEWMRQSAIIGYLVAGTLVGPNVFGFVASSDNVTLIAELGVAMLLFSIGLEFSFERLKRLGRVALIGGTLQVGITMTAAAAVAAAWGLQYRAALAIGAMVALSSTACVLRLLQDRAAMESVYGRNSLGILLMQDVAVIPLVLMMALLSTGGTAIEIAMNLGRTIAMAALLIAVFLVLFKFVVPRLFQLRQWVRNRELPILLAIVLAIGSAVAAHKVNMSPAIGAFVAGALLGESPFAVQIRADVSSIRTIFVTLFFASVGMFGEPVWIFENWALVLAVMTAIIAGKALIVFGVIRLVGSTTALAAATGLCLAQVGEFSFVLAEMGRLGSNPVIDQQIFRLIVSSTILTLFVTPFLVGVAPHLADWLASLRYRRAPNDNPPVQTDSQDKSSAPAESDSRPDPDHPNIILIGLGPAGQRVFQELLQNHKDRMLVIDLNPHNLAMARRSEVAVQVGDATQLDVLEHAHVDRAQVIVITVPYTKAARTIIQNCKAIAPQAAILVRARYHLVRWQLQMAGAMEVVDEEEQMGIRLAELVKQYLGDEH